MLIPILLVAAVLACDGLSSTASASSPLTWNESDVNAMWNAYNNAFYNEDGNGYDVYTTVASGSTITGFWEEANEIAMAEDGYEWATTDYNSLGSGSAISSQINELCDGFTNSFTGKNPWWRWDTYDDDILWATMAFARAYQITGNSSRLSDAESAFNYVWTHGQVDGQTNGSWGLSQIQGDTRMYANVNFSFVIAGYLLYELTTNTTYKTEADAVYDWSKTNLYVYNHIRAQKGSTNVCSMIYDRNDSEFGGSQ